MTDIRRWLEELELEQYFEAFETNEISFELLPELDHDVLKDVGVEKVGHRLKILKAAKREADKRHNGHDAAHASTTSATQGLEPERRQITVMFCDLVGSTALSERLDPEDLRTLMQAYQKVCGSVIERYEGHVAQYLGDGLMTYFGWPVAHEDDAERAVRSGLEIVEAVKQVKADPPLMVRVGIATGAVVVGETGEGDASVPKLAVGETPNLAARVQGLAGEDQIVIADSSHRLTGGVFDYADLGEQALKGIVDPVRVWQVTGVAATRDRFEATHGDQLTPLIGRDAEISMLMQCWDRAKDGEGQVVLLRGEPGIGKSRITQAMRARIANEPHLELRYQCSPYYNNSAFYPLIDQLERAAGFTPGDTSDQKLDKLEGLLAQSAVDPQDLAPLIAAVMLLPVDRYPPLNLSPQQQKERTIAALADQMVGLTRKQSVLLVMEDAHWIDPTTVEAIGAVIERIRDLRGLFIVTYRPEFEPPWSAGDYITTLTLNRLSGRLGADLVAEVTGGKALPDEVLDQIVVKTDGVPLFVEELTKTVLEAGFLRDAVDHYELDGAVPSFAIPATLQDSLMARLDRLAPAKEVAQTGACLGRTFSHELLATICPLRDIDLRTGLQELASSELVFQHGKPPSATYTFKHALIQDAAYASLLKSKRQNLHQRIAEVLLENFPEIGDNEPEVVARHYTQAGIVGPAINYWEKAGIRAIDRSANVEAAAQLRQGLDLIQTEKESGERDQRELMLLVRLGTALTASYGYANEDVERTFSRARVLCEQLGATPHLFPVMSGLYRFYFARSELNTALNITQQMLNVAEGVQDPSLLLEAHLTCGICLAFLGQLGEALEHIEKSLSLFDAERDANHRFIYGNDAMVALLSVRAIIMWLQGYPEQAVDDMNTALRRARDLRHPFTEAWALNFATVIFELSGDDVTSKAHAEHCIDVATKHDFPLWLAGGTIMLGAAIFRDGEDQARGVELMSQGLAAWRATGSEIFRPYYVLLLARAYGELGRYDEAIDLVDSSLSDQDRHDEAWMVAESHRVRADLLRERCLRQDDCDATNEAIDAALVKAMDIAQSQDARALELRTRTSTLRHRLQRGAPSASEHEALSALCRLLEGRGRCSDLEQAEQLLADAG